MASLLDDVTQYAEERRRRRKLPRRSPDWGFIMWLNLPVLQCCFLSHFVT